jgi:hypothetical protein
LHPAFFFLIALGIGTLIFVLWKMEQKRREALLLWATGKGWDMRPQAQKKLHDRWAGLKVFDKGHSRSGKNIITGKHRGIDCTLIDYKYVTGSGKNRSTHNRGVVILACDHPTIPLQMRRENPFDKMGEFLGMDDIDFESAEFSRKFYVKSSDRKWAYDVIHTRTMEYLLKGPSYMIEFGFAELCIYKNGHFNPETYEQALEFGKGLLDLTPDYVVKQMKGDR